MYHFNVSCTSESNDRIMFPMIYFVGVHIIKDSATNILRDVLIEVHLHNDLDL